MSGAGVPQIDDDELKEIAKAAKKLKLKVAVVAAQWHQPIMDGLVGGADRYLSAVGLDDYTMVRVAGSFELPVVAAHTTRNYDVIIALGVVIRGETPHFDYVCQAATDGLSRLSISTGKPIGFGLLTVDDEAQAVDRAGLPGSKEDVGRSSAHAAVTAALEISRLKK
ncbi:6,7-dimethyl-8-ribityllumazine synthase [Nesterenkonia populi]|uniref:6,7-dimethyl-8-ribityllumazine synthase n=1 Tax=Nesterenkonia populi TaxID=1591087 RepID=UPI0011BE3C3D|nr:6,7-dimethyl-8-ribityllumazine synthase [Nesterenkonia populi]